MPLLKDLNCSIELSEDQKPLQELGTVYGDAFVETFIPVPKKQQTFTVHLSSTNFIAPGIAMYVFIDGVYQCNRNRQNMKLRKPPDRRSLVDFKVRQKEEKLKDGSMIAREWTFEKLDHASADGAPDSCSPNILDNIGCIEVVVLRCAGSRNARTAANMNLDGATDYPDYRFDRDSRSRTIAYDDREPFSNTAGRHDPPPRISSYRSPYAETVRSKDPPKRAYSRFSEPVSPGTRPQRDIPAPAFQYGSGPLPPQAKAHIHKDFADETMLNNAPKSAPTVDPDMLEKIVADAVKRGVAESRQNNMSNGIVSRDDERGVGSSSRVPGAWPTSPTHRSKHRSHRSTSHKHHDGGDARYDRNSAWEHRPTRSRAESHVAWDEEPGWDKQSRADGWGSPEDNAADSWDTEETWSKRKPDDWEEVCHRSNSRDRVARSPSRPRRASYISTRTPERQRLKHSRSHRSQSKTRSHWIDDSKVTSEDNDGWTPIEAPYDPNELQDQSDSTLEPSHSRSQVQPFKSKPGRRNSVHLSSQRRHEQRLSQLVENPQWHPKSAYHARPPSVLVTNAPTVMSASISQWPADIRLRKQSVHTQPAASFVAPPPIWGCASQKPRKNSAATTYLPPAPFSTIGVEHHESRNSSGSSSWGIMGKDSLKDEEKKISPQQSTWGGDKKSDKDQSVWGEADNKETDGNADQRQGWGDDKAAEQNDGCWNNTEKDNNQWGTSDDTKDAAVDGWDIANNGNDAWGLTDTKDTEAGGWNMENNNSWEQKDPPKGEQNDNGGFDAGNADNNGWHTKQNNNTSWDQPQETTNNEPFNPDAGWAVEPVVDEKANEKGKSVSASKRHTSKSLSKYRQLSAPALEAKPHWQFPPPLAKKTLHPLTEDQASEQSGRRRRVPSVPSEPFYKIPKSLADEKGVQHQVLAGPGTQYGHAINRPEYMDHLDKPYAVFQFKYRSRSMLRSMFGNDCLSKSGTTMVPVQKEDLKALPHDELVKKMLALQSKLEDKEGRKGEEGEKGSQCTESVAMDRAEEWVKQHSRNASEQGKAKKAATEKSKAKSAEKVAGWDDGGANGGEKWNGKAVNW